MPPKKTLHPWLAHLQGLTAIIKSRNKKNGLCFSGIGLSVALNSSLKSSDWAINYNDSVDDWFIDSLDHHGKVLYHDFVALKPSSVANGRSISASLDDLILRTQPVLQATPLLFEGGHPEVKAKVARLLAAARSQLSSFRDWRSRIPEPWQPQTIHHQIEASEFSRQDVFSGSIDVYPNCKKSANLSAEFG